MAEFFRSLNRAATAVHVRQCANCYSEHVQGSTNEQGKWFGICLMCGCRFWDHTPAVEVAAGL